MTTEEAITQLELEDRRSYPKRRLGAHVALKLGINALKEKLDREKGGEI